MNIHIVYGDINTGKSTMLTEFVQHARMCFIYPAGIIARGIWNEREKCGFYAHDIRTGKEWDLVYKNQAGFFKPKSFDVFSRITAQAQLLHHTYIYILDEIGKFELQHKGHYDTLQYILAHKSYYNLVLVVRTALVQEIITHFHLDTFPIFYYPYYAEVLSYSIWQQFLKNVSMSYK